MSYSNGNIIYTAPPAVVPAATVTAANNGLELTGTTVQLGQTNNQAGNPSSLLSDREIFLNNHILQFRQVFGVDVVAIAQGAIDITNNSAMNNPPFLQLTDLNTGSSWILEAAANILSLLDQAGNGFIYDQTAQKIKLQALNGTDLTGGFGAPIRSVTANDTFSSADYTILVDATAGPVAIVVSALAAGRIGNIKKIDATFNGVTMTKTGGQIFNNGLVASLTFSQPGTNIQFQSDGTNIYTL